MGKPEGGAEKTGDDGKKPGDDGEKPGDDGKKPGDDGKPVKPAEDDMKKYPKAAAFCQGSFRADAKVAARTSYLNTALTEVPCEEVWNDYGGESETDGAARTLKMLGLEMEETFKEFCC